jgi:hypothetical protein
MVHVVGGLNVGLHLTNKPKNTQACQNTQAKKNTLASIEARLLATIETNCELVSIVPIDAN